MFIHIKYLSSFNRGPLDNLLTPQSLKQPLKKTKPEYASSDKEFEEFIHDETDYYRRDTKGSAQKDKGKAKHAVEKGTVMFF